MNHVIVDGNSVAHWRFWATPQRQDEQGRECGMLFSLVEWLRDVERAMEADALTVCFDAPRNWRYDIAPDYKGHRGERHPALGEQLARLALFVAEHHFAIWVANGYEADDLCAAALDRFRADHYTVISRDKDLRQLVDDARGVRVFDPVARVWYDEAAVLAKHGVPAYRLRDLLAICGDTADNVKGAPQWGEDTTAKAIAETLDFEHLLDTVRELGLTSVSERKQALLREMEQQIRQNYEIVGLRAPAPTPL